MKSENIATTAFLTSRSLTAAEWLEHDGVAVLPFGPDMYALFSIPTEVAAEKMASMKGRGGSPFVRTTSPIFRDGIPTATGISKTVTPKALKVVDNLFKNGARQHPVGVLFSADQESNIPERLVGRGVIKINGEPQTTVGFMVSGPDKNYQDVVNNIDGRLLAGTSANYTRDTKDGGSGHHHIAGVLAQFANQPGLCIFVPQAIKEGHGPSTSLAHISTDGKVAHLVREGSIPHEEMINLLHEAGIEEVGKVDGFKKIKPYTYDETNTPFGGNPALREIYMWGIHQLMTALTRTGDRRVPLPLARALFQYVPR